MSNILYGSGCWEILSQMKKNDWSDQDVVLSVNAENIINQAYDKWGSFKMKEN